jgi:hypothetical protein
MAARALAIVHTCMYDAWAAYDERAVGTQLRGALRRPAAERTLANKEEAVSYAAYRALADVLPADRASVYDPLMRRLGYDAGDDSTDIETPAGIGNVACAAVLEFRHHDKANQLGDLAPGAYSDWTGYAPANKPAPVPPRAAAADPSRWQPLVYVNSTGDLVSQRFMAPQWCFVTPFALAKGDELRGALRPFAPADYGTAEYARQARELVDLSAKLTDAQKAVAEYWLDGPNSEQPPGHWMLFAQWVSGRDRHTLDDDVKMFFALSNALLDAGAARRGQGLGEGAVVFRRLRGWGPLALEVRRADVLYIVYSSLLLVSGPEFHEEWLRDGPCDATTTGLSNSGSGVNSLPVVGNMRFGVPDFGMVECSRGRIASRYFQQL